METVKVFENNGEPVEIVYIGGNEYATNRRGVACPFPIRSLERWLCEEYGDWYRAGRTRQEHLSLIALGVMAGLV